MSEGYRPQATIVTKTLITTFAAGLVIGILIGWGAATSRTAPPVESVQSASVQPENTAPVPAPDPAPAPERTATPEPAEPIPGPPFDPDVDGLWPAEQLFVGINGLKADIHTQEWLNEFKPGGVVLGPENVADPLQLAALVLQIKQAVGRGTTIADPPFILYQDGESSLPRLLGDPDPARLVADAPADQIAVAVAAAGEGRKQGIAVILGPTLDIAAAGPIGPDATPAELEGRAAPVVNAGLAYHTGLRAAGLLSVPGVFPGAGIAQGEGRTRHIPATHMNLLAAAMQPFKAAIDAGVPGILVGHVAVPGIDVEQPNRPASLSPKLLQLLLRDDWGYAGVIVAGDITRDPMVSDMPRDEIVIKALVSGCDAVIVLDADRDSLRPILDKFVQLSSRSDFPVDRIEASKQRLAIWRERLKQSPPPADKPAGAIIARATPPVEEISTTPAPEAPAPEPTPAEPSPPAESAPEEPETPEPAPEPESAPEAPVAEPEAAEPAPADPVATDSAPEAPVAEPDVAKATPAPEATPAEPASDAGAMPETAVPAPVVPDNATLTEHTIAKGESLTVIANRYKVSLAELRAWNELEDDNIKFGRKLKIYKPAGEPGPATAPGTAETAPATAPENALAPVIAAESAMEAIQVAPEKATLLAPSDPAEDAVTPAPPVAPPPNSRKQEHTVQAGETIEGIADEYGVAMADVLAWNGKSPDQLVLEVGAVVLVYLPVAAEDSGDMPSPEVSPAPEKMPAPAPGAFDVYVVGPGDNLRRIAGRFGTTQQALIELNQIARPDHVEIGQKLKVPKLSTATPETGGGAPQAPAEDSGSRPE